MSKLYLLPVLKDLKETNGRNYVGYFWRLFGKQNAWRYISDWNKEAVIGAFTTLEPRISANGLNKKVDRFIENASNLEPK